MAADEIIQNIPISLPGIFHFGKMARVILHLIVLENLVNITGEESRECSFIRHFFT